MRQIMGKVRNLAANNTKLKNAKSIGSRNFKTNAHGITLIALVITIIVLLILAGVSISAITGNDSAMKKAKEAKTASEKGDDLDTIKLAVVDAVAHSNDGFVNADNLKSSLKGVIKENPDNIITGDGPWIVTGLSGGVYEINKNSNVNELTGLVLIPKNVVLRIENDIYEETTITARLIDIEGTLTWSDSTDIIDVIPAQDGKSALIKAKKNGTETVTVNCSNGDTAECIIKVTKEMPLAKDTLVITNNVSQYVNYTDKNGNTILCRVLYNDIDGDNTHGLQIISADSVEGVGLGTADENYKDDSTLTELQKAQNSYNNAIENLNNKAESYNNISLSYDARCVGSVATVTNNTFANKDDETEIQSNGYKGEDTHYEEDFNTMGTLSIRKIFNQYWLASRRGKNSDKFIVYYVYSGGDLSPHAYFFDLYGRTYDLSQGFRPVFLLKSNVRISGGTGTSGDPYILEAGA